MHSLQAYQVLKLLNLSGHRTAKAWAGYTTSQNRIITPVPLQALPNVGTNDFFARFTYRVGDASHLVTLQLQL